MAFASSAVLPTTAGTWVPGCATQICTEELGATFVPARGDCRSTVPGCADEYWLFTTATRPAWLSLLSASALGRPRTNGTVDLPTPEEMTRLTFEPDETVVPCDGLLEMM